MHIIETLEREEIARLNKTIPDFAPGDTVIVNVNVVEGERKRVQAYEGVVIARRNRGLNSAFTVRKISSGEGVERTFQTYSPLIASIEVKRRGDVRRAKLYYLRGRIGKRARVRERRSAGPEVAVERELLYGPDADGEPTPVDAEGATAEETVAEAVEAQDAAAEAAEAPPADAETAEAATAETEPEETEPAEAEPAAAADATEAGEEEPAADDE